MSDSNKKLFLLDAYALIYRAYYAFIKNPRVNSKGLNTSAIFGFSNTLLEVLNKQKPSHIGVVFDTAAPTERHENFAEYKANREETPEDIKLAIPYIKLILESLNIPVLFMDGYEADDVIGTLAKEAEKDGFQVFMMTPDKDYAQLVSDNIFMYKPARMGNGVEILGVPEVCAKFEIDNPLQVIDILGLMGDASDNIPGVPGVGEKTAKKFIKEYGSIENLYQNLDQLKGKLKIKVEENHDKAVMSKQLATIILDVPIEWNPQSLEIEAPNKEGLKNVFAELEFRTLSERFLGESYQGSSSNNGQTNLFDVVTESKEEIEAVIDGKQGLFTIENTPHQYVLADNEATLKKLANELAKQSCFCFDTETTGIDANTAALVGVAFSFKKGEAYYVPVTEEKDDLNKKMGFFRSVFANEKIEKIGHNIKYDIMVLRHHGLEVKGKLFDTMLAHYLIQPEMRHNMDILAETYLNYIPVSIETLIGKKGKNQLSMRQVPVEQVAEYAGEDADITFQLYALFKDQLKEKELFELFDTMEMPLVDVLSEMETEGVKIDSDTLRSYSLELKDEIGKIQKEIYEDAGSDFNISSPKQLGEILFDQLKIVDKPKKTKTGQYSTSEETLVRLENSHPIIRRILEYRSLVKLKSTYVDVLPDLVNPSTGRIHTSYNQAVAATGRLSSNNPNLQNIPIRTTRGKEIRKAFVPRGGDYTLLAADYSQIELRIIAELSEDKDMIAAFVGNEDIHATTASKVFDVPLNEVTRDMRSKAKTVNFGIIYGISAFGLSQRINIPRGEASEIIKQYFLKYPGVKNYMERSIELAKEKGYVETIMGRKRFLSDINSNNAVVRGHAERNAINAPIQGSAADMIKLAMIRIHNSFKNNQLKSKMILQVHDELVFDAHKSELEIIKPLIEDGMKNAINMKVPIVVEMGTGENWLEAH